MARWLLQASTEAEAEPTLQERAWRPFSWSEAEEAGLVDDAFAQWQVGLLFSNAQTLVAEEAEEEAEELWEEPEQVQEEHVQLLPEPEEARLCARLTQAERLFYLRWVHGSRPPSG